KKGCPAVWGMVFLVSSSEISWTGHPGVGSCGNCSGHQPTCHPRSLIQLRKMVQVHWCVATKSSVKTFLCL
ncbi:expressed protein, partial [Phakopsora pachyrhizi]